MDLYYLLLKIAHLIGMASWFGVALAISIILSKKDKNDYELILDLSTKVEMPASFFMPLKRSLWLANSNPSFVNTANAASWLLALIPQVIMQRQLLPVQVFVVMCITRYKVPKIICYRLLVLSLCTFSQYSSFVIIGRFASSASLRLRRFIACLIPYQNHSFQNIGASISLCRM